MSSNTVIVTGSSGLIGTAIAERLLANGYQVIGFDNEGSPFPPANIEWVFADLTSDESVQNAMQIVQDRHGLNIASCIHLAAYYSFAHQHSPLYQKLTVDGTGRLLRELQRFSCQQFIFSSTILVHAPSQPGHPINEDSPLEPKWAYPESKVKTEKLIRERHGSIPSVILRIAGVYDDWCRSIPIAHQIKRIYEDNFESHLFPGDLSHGQSFVHLSDLIDCMVLAVEERLKLPEDVCLLVGEPQTYSYQQLQDEIGNQLTGHGLKTIKIPKWVAKDGAWLEKVLKMDQFVQPWMIDFSDDDYELDISRANSLLGWMPRHRLIKDIAVMTRHLKENPLQWYKRNKLTPPHWLSRHVKDAQGTAAA